MARNRLVQDLAGCKSCAEQRMGHPALSRQRGFYGNDELASSFPTQGNDQKERSALARRLVHDTASLLKRGLGESTLERFRRRAVWVALALLVFAMGPAHLIAASSAEAGQPETTIPQGENPPGAADDGLPEPLPPGEHKGVIEPPDIGDEGIHTDFHDPHAGH